MRARPKPALPYLLAFVLGVSAGAIAACGSTNKAMIPAESATKLKSDLDEVLNAIDTTDCNRADRAIAQVRADLDALPAGTSQRLERRLREAVAKLAEQTARECERTTTTETTATAQTETTHTETIPTTTTETAPPTVPTTPTTTTPTVPTTPTTPTTTPTTTSDTGGAGTP